VMSRWARHFQERPPERGHLATAEDARLQASGERVEMPKVRPWVLDGQLMEACWRRRAIARRWMLRGSRGELEESLPEVLLHVQARASGPECGQDHQG